MPGGDRPRGRGKDADYGVSNNHADCIFLLSLSIFLSLSAYLSAFTRSVTRKPMDLSCFLARLHLPPMEHPWRKNFKKSRKEITENRISYFCFIGKKGKKKKNFEFGVVDYISIISLILKMRKINSLSFFLSSFISDNWTANSKRGFTISRFPRDYTAHLLPSRLLPFFLHLLMIVSVFFTRLRGFCSDRGRERERGKALMEGL